MSSKDHSSISAFVTDAHGNRVRIGLTWSETLEFERLDSREPLDPKGHPIPWYAQSESIRRSEDRWFELYRKHEQARLKRESRNSRRNDTSLRLSASA